MDDAASNDLVPEVEEIARQLRDAIHTGQYAPGSAVPSREELVDTFGVTGPVAQRALKQLREEGLIVGDPASGHIVRNPSHLEIQPREVRMEVEKLRLRVEDLEHRVNNLETGSH